MRCFQVLTEGLLGLLSFSADSNKVWVNHVQERNVIDRLKARLEADGGADMLAANLNVLLSALAASRAFVVVAAPFARRGSEGFMFEAFDRLDTKP